jgi:hypothetical protein
VIGDASEHVAQVTLSGLIPFILAVYAERRIVPNGSENNSSLRRICEPLSRVHPGAIRHSPVIYSASKKASSLSFARKRVGFARSYGGLSFARAMGTVTEMDGIPVEPDQLGETQTRQGREQQQRVIAASKLCRSIRSGKDRLNLGSG